MNTASQPHRLFLTPDITLSHAEGGIQYLKSNHQLDDVPASVLEHLYHWASQAPDRTFIAERNSNSTDGWRRISYSQMLKQAHQLATALDATELGHDRPLLAVSGNSVAMAVVMFACFLKKAPFIPISPAYSLLSTSFSKVKYIQELTQPSVVFAESYSNFKPVLDLLEQRGLRIITADSEPASDSSQCIQTLIDAHYLASIPPLDKAINGDTVAKILFTSGSTGMPKGVINTHRMMASNQEAIAKIWPFIEAGDQLLDWLPWNHTFGGNHNLNMALRNGCTLYIDNGKPAAGAMQATLDNLGEISPALYFNVASGYDLLSTALENDEDLARNFFKNLKILFFAAAALPVPIWNRLQALIDQYASQPIPITSSWGATETAPLCTSVYFTNSTPSNIGVPVPGTDAKLVPVGDMTELRIKGPNVTPGYFNDPAITAEVFDDEGYFCSGDAVELANPDHPEQGLLFKGRVSENFKLTTGTWVNVGELRLAVVAALAPLASDVVICGESQAYLSILIFPNSDACQTHLSQPDEDIFSSTVLREAIKQRLIDYNATQSASSRQIKKALLQPPTPIL
jgi:feruloyl-CoA synthase